MWRKEGKTKTGEFPIGVAVLFPVNLARVLFTQLAPFLLNPNDQRATTLHVKRGHSSVKAAETHRQPPEQPGTASSKTTKGRSPHRCKIGQEQPSLPQDLD